MIMKHNGDNIIVIDNYGNQYDIRDFHDSKLI